MTWIDWLILGIILLLVGGACLYIFKARKAGKKCIGCPDAGSCGGNCSGGSCCSGSK